MVYLKVSFVLSARIIFRNMFFRQFGETFFFLRYFVRIQTAQCTTCKMDTIGRDVFLNTLHSQISCRCVGCVSILMLDNTSLQTHISHANRHFQVDDFLTTPVLVGDVIAPGSKYMAITDRFPYVQSQQVQTQCKTTWPNKKVGDASEIWSGHLMGFLIQPIKRYSLLDIQTSPKLHPKPWQQDPKKTIVKPKGAGFLYDSIGSLYWWPGLNGRVLGLVFWPTCFLGRFLAGWWRVSV